MGSSKKKRNRPKLKSTHGWIALVIAFALLIYFGITGSDKPVFIPGENVSSVKPNPQVEEPTEIRPSSEATPTGRKSDSPDHPKNAENPLDQNFDFTPKPALQKTIAERFGKAEVVVQSPDVKESERFFTRSTIYRTNFKYPLLRVDDRYENDESEEPKLVSRNVRVADHLLVTIKTSVNEADFTHSIENMGFKIRKKMSAARHYLIQFSAPNPEALDRARESIKGLSSVESVDPDFIVSVD